MRAIEDVINKHFNLLNIGHAYLLKTNDYLKVIDIAKSILLKSNPNEPNIEKLIDEGIYPDLVVIEPDGQWIKKEQILSLKDKFKTKSSYDGKQIYIIKNAENLNKSSGNTLLKFLEEPEENIIALLITENKTKVLETLVSRCQYIVLDSNVENIEKNETQIIDIINIIEDKKQKAAFDILNYLEQFTDKNEIKDFLMNVINIYDKILLRMLNIDIKTFEYEELFDKISKNNTIEDIKRRINGLIFIIDSLEYNINIKLLVDKLMISMFGVD